MLAIKWQAYVQYLYLYIYDASAAETQGANPYENKSLPSDGTGTGTGTDIGLYPSIHVHFISRGSLYVQWYVLYMCVE